MTFGNIELIYLQRL